MGFVLDTSALIELERALAAGWIEELASDDDVVLPAAAWAEALIGIRMADSPARASRRRAALEAIRLRTGVVQYDSLRQTLIGIIVHETYEFHVL